MSGLAAVFLFASTLFGSVMMLSSFRRPLYFSPALSSLWVAIGFVRAVAIFVLLGHYLHATHVFDFGVPLIGWVVAFAYATSSVSNAFYARGHSGQRYAPVRATNRRLIFGIALVLELTTLVYLAFA